MAAVVSFAIEQKSDTKFGKLSAGANAELCFQKRVCGTEEQADFSERGEWSAGSIKRTFFEPLSPFSRNVSNDR
jgi:hypothetical protein